MRVLLLLSLLAAATSFVLFPQSSLASSPRQHQGLLDSANNPEDTEHHDELEEIAAARRRLEFLVNDFDDDLPEKNGNDEIPLLSTIGRQRKEVEIELLQALGESDEPTGDLWTLWYWNEDLKRMLSCVKLKKHCLLTRRIGRTRKRNCRI